MLDDVLDEIELEILSYNISVNADMMNFAAQKPNFYLINFEARVERFSDVGMLSQQIVLVKKDSISNYTKFLKWAKKEHPEIVIEYEMTKDENKS